MNNSWRIGIDLGGTSFKCGLISPDNKIVARNQAPTNALEGPAQAAERIAENVRALLPQVPQGEEISAVGICSPGPLDHTTGVLIEPPNLGWKNVPFAQMVSDELDMPVALEHDAKAAALGEYHFGAGRGSDAMALIIVGTGISAGIIINGKLYRGVHDTAGELGHITVDTSGPICRCGSNGCVETYASGPGILAAYEYAAHTRVESPDDIVRAAQNGDEIARRVFERAGSALGAGLGTLAMLVDISTFVMFGGVTAAGELILEPTRKALAHYSYKSVSARARIVLAELGNDAGILGAGVRGNAQGFRVSELDTEQLGFIFDLDGTIVDSTHHYRVTWAEFIAEYGLNDNAEDYLKRATRENLRVLLGDDATEHELEKHAKRHAESGNAKMRSQGIVAHDGVIELIQALHARGIKIGLATAAEKSNAEWTLEQLEIRELFDAVVVDRDVARGKPAPDIYLEAMRRLGVDAAHCAVMEDSATGIRVAKSAGLRVIAVITTHSRRELDQAGADLIIERATALSVDDVIQFITQTI